MQHPDARSIKKDFLNIGRILGQFRRRPDAQRMGILRGMGLGPGRLPRTPQRRPDRGFVVGRGRGGGGRGFRKHLPEESNMNEHTLNRLQAEVDDLIAKIDQEVTKGHRITIETDTHNGDDDDGYGDGDSNTSLASSESDDDDNGNGNDNGNDVDDEEDDDDVSKALDGTDSNTYYENVHSAANRPGALKTSTHSQPRHKFEALVSHIANDQGCPKSEAMAIARQHYPDVYRSYQRHTSNSDTSKRAPSSFEDLVNAEMAKGCNREIAGQRVAQLHGFRAFDNGSRITKRRGDLLYEFQKRVDEIMYKDGVDATEATRRARMEDPALFRAMQRAG
jgi:hypothetical protein